MSKQPDFNSIFFSNEFRALTGTRNGVIVRLSGLLFVTLLALGFAVGGLNNLRKRMDNPFTNWVDIEVSNKVNKALPKLKPYFSNGDTLKAYHLAGTDNWNLYFLSFYNRKYDPVRFGKDTLQYLRFGRTVNTGDALFRSIVDPNSKNLLYRNPDFFDKEQNLVKPCGIILTEALAVKLGYTQFDQIKKVAVEASSKVLFLDLIAVVKQLPNLAHFATSPIVYNIVQANSQSCYEMLQQNKLSDSTSVRLLSNSADETEFLRGKITEIIQYQGDPLIQVDTQTLDNERKYFNYEITLLPDNRPTAAKMQKLLAECYATGRFSAFNQIQCSDDCDDIEDPHFLTYNFIDLKKIREFQSTLDEFGVEVPMHQVEAKENFRLVTSLTLIISSVLFVLGILSIILYLGNLLLNHIGNIRPNLGTFKAFGLGNKVLSDLYSMIILRMLGIGILIAAPLAAVCGLLMDKIWLKIGFNLIHWVIALSLIIIAAVCVLIARRVLARVLSLTPGDLIYER